MNKVQMPVLKSALVILSNSESVLAVVRMELFDRTAKAVKSFSTVTTAIGSPDSLTNACAALNSRFMILLQR